MNLVNVPEQCEKAVPDDWMLTSVKGGSMNSTIFLAWCRFFIKFIDKSRFPLILFIDGHVSRRNSQALRLLRANDVYAIVLPSHTTISLQPNDCAFNSNVQSLIAEEVSKFESFYRCMKLNRHDYLKCIVTCYNAAINDGFCLF